MHFGLDCVETDPLGRPVAADQYRRRAFEAQQRVARASDSSVKAGQAECEIAIADDDILKDASWTSDSVLGHGPRLHNRGLRADNAGTQLGTAVEERPRKIIHIDMDAFYASVEQRDNPALRGKPVAVGGSRERGVVAAASYEARRFGVRSAMPSVTARRKCPELIFVKPRFDVYKAVSLQVRAIFSEYTAIIEPLSLDEAYLDVTENLQDIASATEIAERIRSKIRAETQLTASAGISYNKFLAKLASDYRKPDGLFVITSAMGPSFVEALPVERFHGVGPATAAEMKELGIFTALDLRAKDEAFLLRHFGKAGQHFYRICRGIDHRPVLPNRMRKSVGAENTFSQDLTSFEEMRAELSPLVDKVWQYCDSTGVRGRTVTLKIKFANFQIITRSRSRVEPISDRSTLASVSAELLAAQFPMRKGVRLIGVSLSSLCADPADVDTQMTLGL
jgi:DNA polymerase-4